MYARLLALLVALSLTACTVGPQYPDIPEAPVPREAPPPPPVEVPPAPEPTLEAVWPEHVPATLPLPPPTPARKGRAVEPVERPEQVIREAQQAARVVPSRRGYWGASGVQRYVWVPGKIYTIYLAVGMGTKLTLPPGETLAHALILNPKSFDVSTANVGNELATNSIILIRPCAASEEGCVPAKEVEVAVTSTAGRGYNLHLIVGTVGMVECTWELTPVPHIEVAEPGMLPRKQP